MGCTLSVWSTLYDSVVPNSNDVWIGDRRFRVVKELGEGGFAFVYLVKEMPTERPQELPRSSYVAGEKSSPLDLVGQITAPVVAECRAESCLPGLHHKSILMNNWHF